LQVVASLLNLQGRELRAGRPRDVVDELKHRVRAIALLHEGLYRTTELPSVELGPYLRRLAADLQRSSPNAARRVTYSAEHQTFVVTWIERCHWG
jgi:two-component sensor histidine kinase